MEAYKRRRLNYYFYSLFIVAAPDRVMINYSSKIVSICTRENKVYDDSTPDKLNIMNTLALSETELENYSDKEKCTKYLQKAGMLCTSERASGFYSLFREYFEASDKSISYSSYVQQYYILS